ncbi:hypothetical protein GCK72_018687 [Caenorhabditis remanei]|uniref:Uncharacterized protein n=1 Tax=Caenorhabditis remanei TaxID=31234 RepID=A0A6A5GBU4_CAERE|nr:hypothetical protein GCK72_018687 [Caenorhabditis remanei]KAF1752133.1 hypothetical protein GCK72_018687 [Caenorhabditis remanei]
MESEDHEYFCSKNNGPRQSQNHDRNRNADHQLAHMKDKSGVMKTYHVWTGENQFTNRYWEKMDRTVMNKDLNPFVVYSMNKRKNWEIEEMDSIELMRQIQELHREQDVMLLERVSMRVYGWPNLFRYDFFWDDYKIHTLHELDSYVSGKPAYKKTVVNSGRGHHPHSFLSWNRTSDKEESERIRNEKLENIEREKRTVVAYHLIKSPNNYMDIFKKEFERDNTHSSRWAPPTYWERKRKQYSNELDVRYDDLSEDEVEEVELNQENEGNMASKCYNLEDHFVENFVHVKRKKNKKKNDNSGV